MKVSIIIPIYNVEPYIADCLRSVTNQTFTGEIECILVDDCGQDRSIEIVELIVSKYSGPIKFIILHHINNKGLSAARNTGLRAATGEYIYFLDSDDEISPDCLSLLCQPLKTRSYDMVIGDYKILGTGNNYKELGTVTEKEYLNDEIPQSYLTYKWAQTAWNKLYNLKYIQQENLLFKEGLIHEDELWSLEIAATAKSIIVVAKKTYYYKVRENSITTEQSASSKKLLACNIIHKEFTQFLKKRNLIKNQKYFPLYLRAFDLATGEANIIGKKALKKSFKVCHSESKLTIKDFFGLYHFNIKAYVFYMHVALPSPLGLLYYDLMHKFVIPIYAALLKFSTSFDFDNSTRI